MSTPFLGSLMPTAFGFAPKGWALCQGQLLAIAQYQALFSLLGTTYGGDGRTTFVLPDLRGRAANSSGQGPGLGGYALGQVGGVENVTLQITEMPSHPHTWSATSSAGNAPIPASNVLAGAANFIAAPPDPASGTLSNGTIANAGGSQPHTNQSPYLTINWIIALVGIFPSPN